MLLRSFRRTAGCKHSFFVLYIICCAVVVSLQSSRPSRKGVPRSSDTLGRRVRCFRLQQPVDLLSGLCERSWLVRHPVKIEITRSSGGSSHHTKFFFFFCKNHDFSRFLINFSTVVVVKHTHVVDLKRLTHIHSHRDLNSLSLSTESTYLLVPMP